MREGEKTQRWCDAYLTLLTNPRVERFRRLTRFPVMRTSNGLQPSRRDCHTGISKRRLVFAISVNSDRCRAMCREVEAATMPLTQLQPIRLTPGRAVQDGLPRSTNVASHCQVTLRLGGNHAMDK